MTFTPEIIQQEADLLRSMGFDRLLRNHNEYVRAAKAHLDCANVIQRYGSLAEGYLHAGWPWGVNLWKPDRFDAQKHVLRAAAFLLMEYERIDEIKESIHTQRVAALPVHAAP